MPAYVRFTESVESPEPGEAEVIDRIIASMQAEGRITRERYGKAVRTSHAKSHGLGRLCKGFTGWVVGPMWGGCDALN